MTEVSLVRIRPNSTMSSAYLHNRQAEFIICISLVYRENKTGFFLSPPLPFILNYHHFSSLASLFSFRSLIIPLGLMHPPPIASISLSSQSPPPHPQPFPCFLLFLSLCWIRSVNPQRPIEPPAIPKIIPATGERQTGRRGGDERLSYGSSMIMRKGVN